MRAMGPALVIELPPSFDEHLGLGPAAEPFPVQGPVRRFVGGPPAGRALTQFGHDRPALPSLN